MNNVDYMYLIVSRVEDHPECRAKTITLATPNGEALPVFRAGQYLSLKLNIGDSFVTRPYSISSSPKAALSGEIGITICENPDGFAADWILDNLKEGASVVSSVPEGAFFRDEEKDGKDIIALAGGSGITPFFSMAQAIYDGMEDFNLTILYGNETAAKTLFKAELDEIAANCEKVKVVHILSEEELPEYEHGFINGELIKKFMQGREIPLFICGPQVMYEFLAKEFEKLKLPQGLVRKEPSAVTKTVTEHADYPKECAGKSFTIKVYQGQEKYEVQADAGEPVLVALERAGIKAPSSCRSGKCGWCRAKLVSGEIFAPKENEGRESSDIINGYIHPCASFAVSNLEIEISKEDI